MADLVARMSLVAYRADPAVRDVHGALIRRRLGDAELPAEVARQLDERLSHIVDTGTEPDDLVMSEAGWVPRWLVG